MKTFRKPLIMILIITLLTTAIPLVGMPDAASAADAIGYYEANKELTYRAAASDTSDLVVADDGTSTLNVPRGTRLKVTDIQNGYGFARYALKEGWVKLSDCTFVTEISKPAVLDEPLKFVDISQWQPDTAINWSKMKADGISGVILRLGGRYANSSGAAAIYEDTCVVNHYANAKAAGMSIGFYFFSYALTPQGAAEEAQFCIDMINKHNFKPDLPVFIDLEDYYPDRSHELGGRAVNDPVIDAFCLTLENAGYYTGLYTNLDFITRVVSREKLVDRVFWIAQWNKDQICTYTGEYDMHQYTGSGSVDGYNGEIDMNFCYKDLSAFITENGFNGFEAQKNTVTGTEHTHKKAAAFTRTANSCTSHGVYEYYCTECDLLLETKTTAPKAHQSVQYFVEEQKLAAGSLFDAENCTYYALDTANGVDGTKNDEVALAYEAMLSKGGSLITFCAECSEIITSYYFEGTDGCTHKFNVTAGKFKSTLEMNFRSGPHTGKYQAIKDENNKNIRIPVTAEFEVFYTFGDWGYVRYNNFYGWVYLGYGKFTSPITYNMPDTIKEESCTTEGLYECTCLTCEEVSYSYITPVQGHIAGDKNTIAGTCISNGNTTTHCEVCATLLSYKLKDIGEHIYGDYNVTKQPTATEDGTATYVCGFCYKTHTFALPSLQMFDADNSGACDSSDARMTLRKAVNLEPSLSAEQVRRMDANHDGIISAADARLILRMSVRLDSEFDVYTTYFVIH